MKWARVLIMSVVALAFGCANRYRVPANPPNYAADAKIAVKVNKTGNRVVRVKMVFLAPLGRIDPTYRAYAVWISVPGQGITKAGRLVYHERRRVGTLVATTPHAKFEVIVTMEKDPSTSQPQGTEVVRKLVSKI